MESRHHSQGSQGKCREGRKVCEQMTCHFQTPVGRGLNAEDVERSSSCRRSLSLWAKGKWVRAIADTPEAVGVGLRSGGCSSPGPPFFLKSSG